MNVVEEVVDIRERLARIEGNIDHLVSSVDQIKKDGKEPPKGTTGHIVVPITLVTIIVNAVIAAITKLS